MLHAASIQFAHPTTGKQIKIEAPLPEYFEDILTQLDNQN